MNQGSSVRDLAESLRAEVERYSPGAKLPSSRELVERFRVSPVTVSRALSALAAEGLVHTRPGAGTFRAEAAGRRARPGGDTSWQQVALAVEPPDGADAGHPRTVDDSPVLATLAVPPAGVIPFNGGYPHPSLQPRQALSAALARAARRPGAWDRPPVEGLPELRAWFARWIGGPQGGLSAANVLVTAGGQSALSAALRALAPPGAPVLVESPTYPGALAIARAAGLRPVPVPVDGEGVRPDLLAEAFAATGARVFYCQPLFHNPTGAVLAGERRRAVLQAARAAGAFVVEDDYARGLAHGEAPLPSPLVADDADGTVVHVASLTKATSPSLRMGALAARGPVLGRLRAIQAVDSFFVARPLQEATLELVGSPAWARHRRGLAAGLRARRDALAAQLHLHLTALAPRQLPGGGQYFWVRLPEGADERTVVDAALRAGLAVAPGRPFFAAEPPAAHLRLSYGEAAGPEELAEGVRRLRTAFAGAAAAG